MQITAGNIQPQKAALLTPHIITKPLPQTLGEYLETQKKEQSQ